MSGDLTDDQAPKKDVIESAVAVLALMDTLVTEFQPMTLEHISGLLDGQNRPTPKGTLYRQLRTLEHAGWVTCAESGKYRPSSRFAGAAVAYYQYMADAYAALRAEGSIVEAHAQERINRVTNS